MFRDGEAEALRCYNNKEGRLPEKQPVLAVPARAEVRRSVITTTVREESLPYPPPGSGPTVLLQGPNHERLLLFPL